VLGSSCITTTALVTCSRLQNAQTACMSNSTTFEWRTPHRLRVCARVLASHSQYRGLLVDTSVDRELTECCMLTSESPENRVMQKRSFDRAFT
jgi:hypothetical protein